MFIGHSCIFLCEVSVYDFCPFFSLLFALHCWVVWLVYVFWVQVFVRTHLLQIFSPTLACIFTLLMASFDKWKLLILMKYNVWLFLLKVVTQLKLTFIYGVKYESRFICFPYGYSVFPAPFVEKTSPSSLNCFSTFVENQITRKVLICFWAYSVGLCGIVLIHFEKLYKVLVRYWHT